MTVVVMVNVMTMVVDVMVIHLLSMRYLFYHVHWQLYGSQHSLHQQDAVMERVLQRKFHTKQFNISCFSAPFNDYEPIPVNSVLFTTPP